MNPFQQASLPPDMFDYHAVMAKFNVDKAEAKRIVRSNQQERVYLNDLFQVHVREFEPADGWPSMLHLSIRRRDREPIRDWRHMQQIKNALVGAQNEGVEIYPAESRLVDEANQYHMYVLKDPELRFPFGFTQRMVSGAAEAAAVGGKQRDFEGGVND